jgi:hypothetical protein
VIMLKKLYRHLGNLLHWQGEILQLLEHVFKELRMRLSIYNFKSQVVLRDQKSMLFSSSFLHLHTISKLVMILKI